MTPSRWIMSIIYRGETGPVVVDYDVEELEEVAGIVERGPGWNTIQDITIQLRDPDEDVFLMNPLQDTDQ
jgi:hypothetical protein